MEGKFITLKNGINYEQMKKRTRTKLEKYSKPVKKEQVIETISQMKMTRYQRNILYYL